MSRASLLTFIARNANCGRKPTSIAVMSPVVREPVAAQSEPIADPDRHDGQGGRREPGDANRPVPFEVPIRVQRHSVAVRD